MHRLQRFDFRRKPLSVKKHAVPGTEDAIRERSGQYQPQTQNNVRIVCRYDNNDRDGSANRIQEQTKELEHSSEQNQWDDLGQIVVKTLVYIRQSKYGCG